jgi:hypothetical protein
MSNLKKDKNVAKCRATMMIVALDHLKRGTIPSLCTNSTETYG